MWQAGWEGAEQIGMGRAEGRTKCGESRLKRWAGWSGLALPGLWEFYTGESCNWMWLEAGGPDGLLPQTSQREKRGSQTSKGSDGDGRKSAALAEWEDKQIQVMSWAWQGGSQ